MCPRKAKRSVSERNRPMSALIFGKDVDFDHTRSIATADWLRSCRSMAPTPVSSYSNKVFAGSTKSMSVRRPSKSRAVIATPNMRHRPKEQAFSKTLTGPPLGLEKRRKGTFQDGAGRVLIAK
jgi:hypothetical protein